MKREFFAVTLACIICTAALTACSNKKPAQEEPSSSSASSGIAESVSSAVNATSEKIESAAESAKSVIESSSIGGENAPSKEEPEDEGPEPELEMTTETYDDYAWIGLEHIPQCGYLDVVSENHYFRMYDEYTSGSVTRKVEAVDWDKSYTGDHHNKSYTIDGVVTYLNMDTKTYVQMDAAASIQKNTEMLRSAKEEKKNYTERVYAGRGKGSIPEYRDQTGDDAEYEFYEYTYPAPEGDDDMRLIERFYIKDGDVFAQFTESVIGGQSIVDVKVIREYSDEIPEDLFEMPDLSEYTEYETMQSQRS